MTDISTQDRDEFEFGDAHNIAFDGVAKWMKIAAAAEILLGFAYAVPAVKQLSVLNTPPVVIAALRIAVVVLMGFWTIKAARSVNAIVTSEGSDLKHLMSAMAQLKKLFFLQGLVFAALIILAVADYFTRVPA